MGDLPGPGIKLVSPASAGGVLTTGPPGKSQELIGFEVSKDVLGEGGMGGEKCGISFDYQVTETLTSTGFNNIKRRAQDYMF